MYRCERSTIMKPERWRIDIFGLGAGEDSWESLGEQGGQTSKSEKKSTLNIHWKEWCWSWSSNTLATWCEKPTHWKRRWYWERLKANGEGGAEDEMVTCTTDSVDTNLSKFRGIMKDREDWHAAVHGVAKSRMWLSDWTRTQVWRVGSSSLTMNWAWAFCTGKAES